MKKSVLKLRLAKETLRILDGDLAAIAGGLTASTNPQQCPAPSTGTCAQTISTTGATEFCGGGGGTA
jgi:hypothetical protein